VCEWGSSVVGCTWLVGGGVGEVGGWLVVEREQSDDDDATMATFRKVKSVKKGRARWHSHA
jgi:hypothetical protein